MAVEVAPDLEGPTTLELRGGDTASVRQADNTAFQVLIY